MIPIPIFWQQYTATMRGQTLKSVSCENCSIEYLYILEREGAGAGASLYALNNEGAATQAEEGARDTLLSALENDFDPIPCPECGHYQSFMVPRLQQGTWVDPLLLVLLLVGCLVAVNAIYQSVMYALGPSEHLLGKLVTAWVALFVLGLIWLGLQFVRRRQLARFNPNHEDQQARIAMGRSRAITRAEFDKLQQGQQDQSGQPATDPKPPASD